MAFLSVLGGFGPLFYILLGSRWLLPYEKNLFQILTSPTCHLRLLLSERQRAVRQKPRGIAHQVNSGLLLGTELSYEAARRTLYALLSLSLSPSLSLSIYTYSIDIFYYIILSCRTILYYARFCTVLSDIIYQTVLYHSLPALRILYFACSHSRAMLNQDRSRGGIASITRLLGSKQLESWRTPISACIIRNAFSVIDWKCKAMRTKGSSAKICNLPLRQNR